MVRESEYAQSKADFINKLSIALKEANETSYWLSLLLDSQYIEKEQYETIAPCCTEIIKITTASINTAKAERQCSSPLFTIHYSLFIAYYDENIRIPHRTVSHRASGRPGLWLPVP
jgi:hypothetical protein